MSGILVKNHGKNHEVLLSYCKSSHVVRNNMKQSVKLFCVLRYFTDAAAS